MSKIVVLGAGLNGLATGMLLARDGHEVIVLERDPDGPCGGSEELWTSWQRRGVVQFNQLNLALCRWTQTMSAELPEVIAELEARGVARLNVVHQLPVRLTGGVRPGDASFETVTARRPVLEAALARVAERTPGLTVRRGVAVAGLAAAGLDAAGLDGGRPGRVPRVTGVRTVAAELVPAELISADLVVDATGRRSSIPAALEAIGARRPDEEREQTGFVYYARHFRSRDARSGIGGLPVASGLMLQAFHGYSVLTLPADAGTWGIGFVASSRDHALRGLRDVAAWSRAMALVPGAGPWLDAEPISDVQVIAGIEDRYRRFLVDGSPVCTGLVAVGDSWACTNPSLGRGASIGLMHAVALRDALRQVPASDAEGLVRTFDDVTEATITPWYRATRSFDTHRLAEIDADISGRSYLPADPGWVISTALYTAALRDPDVLRAHVSVAHLLASPPEVLSRPGLLPRVMALAAGQPRYPADAPRHEQIVGAIAAETRVPAA